MIFQEAATHSILDRLGLFKDFFEHEVLISSFFYGIDTELKLLYGRVYFLVVMYLAYLNLLIELYGSHLSIFEIECILGIFYKRRSIGGYIELIFTDSYYQGTS